MGWLLSTSNLFIQNLLKNSIVIHMSNMTTPKQLIFENCCFYTVAQTSFKHLYIGDMPLLIDSNYLAQASLMKALKLLQVIALDNLYLICIQ